MYTYTIADKLTLIKVKRVSEESVKKMLETAFLISNPDLRGIKNGDSIAPLQQSIDWIAPFHISISNAMCRFIGLPRVVDCEVVASDDEKFEVMYANQDELDKTMLIYMAYEVVKQMESHCKTTSNILDLTEIIQGFTPKTFKLEAGEIMDSKVLEQSILIQSLADTGLFSRKNSFDLIKSNITEELASPANGI